jgi:penicillin-insensitive murein endopeptidase
VSVLAGSAAAVLSLLATALAPGDTPTAGEEQLVPPAQPPAAPPGQPPTPQNDPRARAEAFSHFRDPVAGKPDSVGAYSNGCLLGAVPLPRTGPGYEVMRLSRNRYYGHPALVAFIQRLAVAAQKKKIGTLLVGDMAQARGGPTPSGHRSHQTGLDVDIGYYRPDWLAKRHIKKAERETVSQIPVVDLNTRTLTAQWGPKVEDLIELAASDPEVARVFVHPRIKRELCDQQAASSKPPPPEPETSSSSSKSKKKAAKPKEPPAPRDWTWLRNVRPWWGHNDHLHVRLKCPADNASCEAQEPMPAGDGCNELAWWETEEARRAKDESKKEPLAAETPPAPPPEVKPPPPLPLACQALLDQMPEAPGSAARTAQRPPSAPSTGAH